MCVVQPKPPISDFPLPTEEPDGPESVSEPKVEGRETMLPQAPKVSLEGGQMALPGPAPLPLSRATESHEMTKSLRGDFRPTAEPEAVSMGVLTAKGRPPTTLIKLFWKMRECPGLSNKDYAEALGISPGAIKAGHGQAPLAPRSGTERGRPKA